MQSFSSQPLFSTWLSRRFSLCHLSVTSLCGICLSSLCVISQCHLSHLSVSSLCVICLSSLCVISLCHLSVSSTTLCLAYLSYRITQHFQLPLSSISSRHSLPIIYLISHHFHISHISHLFNISQHHSRLFLAALVAIEHVCTASLQHNVWHVASGCVFRSLHRDRGRSPIPSPRLCCGRPPRLHLGSAGRIERQE